MKEKQDISQSMKAAREDKRWTLYEASKRSGVRIETIQRVERGEDNYNLKTLLKLIIAYDKEIDIINITK